MKRMIANFNQQNNFLIKIFVAHLTRNQYLNLFLFELSFILFKFLLSINAGLRTEVFLSIDH